MSQNPLDIPDAVLGQLGNRVQHALRAFTPRDQKAVKAAATTFRQNPKLDVEATITQLGVGEALVSFLDEKGAPRVVDRAFVCPPRSQIGPVTPEQRQQIIRQSLVYGHYEQQVDRESAFEMLKARAEQAATAADAPAPADDKSARPSAGQPTAESGGMLANLWQGANEFARSPIGKQIVRGVLGSFLGGNRTRRR